MAYEIVLPRLGWDMEEGALSGWLKADGDLVKSGELLFVVEGDKAVQEIEALDTGILRILPVGPAVGEKVPVGTLLGYLVPEAELATFHFPGGAATEAAPDREPAAEHGSIPSQEASVLAAQAPAKGNGQPKRVYISPYARRLAEGIGVDWKNIAGSGWNGRIMANDVRRAVQAVPPSQPAPVPVPVPPVAAPAAPAATPAFAAAPANAQRRPMGQVRRKTAERMARSAHTTAPVTLTMEVEATEIYRLRTSLKKESSGLQQPVPSYNDILACLCAKALIEFPEVNARLDGEDILLFSSAQIAVAVDAGHGLLVPVLRDVQTKSLRQVARESEALIARARAGQLTVDDLQGATFTITNLGMFEIDAFTPIIDLPQCAVLGVGRIAPKQVVVNYEKEQVAIRQMMTLSLTFDHRLIDGAGAARFLQQVKRYIENPYLWLVGT